VLADHTNSQGLKRPSEYLRERCPLCFGGSNWAKPEEVYVFIIYFELLLNVCSVDSIVCLDACFTQKRRKSQGNSWAPPRQHPETVFVPVDESEKMEATVEAIRSSNPSKATRKAAVSKAPSKATSSASSEDIDYETGLKVPKSVLDECHESFLVADANRVKASTLFFSDTGLMALLCRHDRVLWLVNMTSAGEKQHYALCLLDKLFKHIPKTMRIGVLYDIGCQLHRSCAKHGFLPDALDRIVFGISVFHAYGHQWPCQLVYHPRKCKGFGLTDGEGCERFWSSIKLLIPSLRVSGYYNRIYTLDTQVKHLDKKSMLDLGLWLQRKWNNMASRKLEAMGVLDELLDMGITREYLESQWVEQIQEQTKPLKRQSSKLADKEILDVLTLMKSVETYEEEKTGYQKALVDGVYPDDLTSVDLAGLIDDAQKNVTRAKKAVANKKSKLSVDGRLNLTKLIGNEFLKKRMNALALKQRIRDRLRNRKFELANLERAYRKTVNHLKLEKNAHTQIKRKEPGIQALVQRYNKLCDELEHMIKAHKAPRGAVAPLSIDSDGLYQLDVDDDIWQDVGLSDDFDEMMVVPDWLGNERIRDGIKSLLELQRCEEEERRLLHERLAIQEWMQEEWYVVEAAVDEASNEDEEQVDQDIIYQLEERREYLLRLCVRWETMVRGIPCSLENGWGPSEEMLMNFRKFEFTTQAIEEELGQDESDGEDEDLEGAEYIDNLEAAALLDHYRSQ